jgi:hypothetical protein
MTDWSAHVLSSELGLGTVHEGDDSGYDVAQRCSVPPWR